MTQSAFGSDGNSAQYDLSTTTAADIDGALDGSQTMVDKRNVRRDAERKAREVLGGDLVSTVGDLAMATADRVEAMRAVDDARTRGDELIAAARVQAEKLLTGAQAELDLVDGQYGTAYAAAREAGWTSTQLTGLGYARPAGRKSAVQVPQQQSVTNGEATLAGVASS